MYINYKETHYPCKCRPGSTMVYRGLPDDFPAPIDDVVTLCRDDGFVMREDNPSDYLRQTFESGVLTLTNTPEPEPVTEPEEPTPTVDDRVTTLESENALLKQQVSALSDQNDFQEELIVELANIVYA